MSVAKQVEQQFADLAIPVPFSNALLEVTLFA
jgi:hypothetical protein